MMTIYSCHLTQLKRLNLLFVLFLICILFINKTYGNQALDNISKHDNIFLAESIRSNNAIEIVVVDILKGTLDVNSFAYLKASSSGFASDSEAGGLFLFYISQDDAGRVRVGAVKVRKDYVVSRRGILFNLVELYQHLGLSGKNHKTFPNFLAILKDADENE